MTATKIINVVKDDSFDEIFELFKATTAEEVIFILPKKSKALNDEEHFALIKALALEQGKKISVMSSNPAVAALARQNEFEVLSSGSASAVKPKKRVEEPAPVLAAADDDEIIREDSDLLDPLTPSDEIMGIPDPEAAEDDIEPLKEESEDLDLVEEKVEPEKEEETDELEVEDDLDEDEELDEDDEELDEELEEEPKDLPAQAGEEIIAEDADLTSEEFIEQPVASLAKARKLDGMIHAPAGEGRNVRVHAQDNKMVKLGIKKGAVKKENLEEMAQVWQQEPYNQGESMWTGILKEDKNPSALSNFFSRKKDVNLRRSLPRTAEPSGRSRKVMAAILLLSLVGGGFVYIKAGSAEIVITPISKPLDFELAANVSDQFSSVDATFNKIPGQLFIIEKTAAQEFPATGQREVAQKARGTITVYNTFGSAPQTLIATTRFESSSGLIFRTLRTVTVPGMTVTNGTNSPGSVQVEVIADKAGETYNVPAGRFTIPAFKEKGDTARYEKFYGQSTEAMKDGMSGNAKVVTEQDFAKAKDIVTQKVREEIARALEQEASGLKIAESAPMQITSTTTSTEVDQAADAFTVTMKAQLKTMGFKESDSWNLLRQHVEKTYAVTIVPGKLNVEYMKAILDESKGLLELTMKASGNGYGQIDNERITADLLGKGQDDIVGYLKNADGVGEAKVLLTPFWVKKVPKTKEKVTIQLDYR